VIVGGITVRHDRPTEVRSQDAVDLRIGASTVLDIDVLTGADRPDGPVLTVLSPSGLISVDHRTSPDIRLELLVSRVSCSCQPLHQADEAAMADGEPILSLQAVLDHPTREPLQDGHGADRSNQPGTKAAPADPPRFHAHRLRQHPPPAARALAAENPMLGDHQWCHRRQIDHLHPPHNPSATQRRATAGTRVGGVGLPLVRPLH